MRFQVDRGKVLKAKAWRKAKEKRTKKANDWISLARWMYSYVLPWAKKWRTEECLYCGRHHLSQWDLRCLVNDNPLPSKRLYGKATNMLMASFCIEPKGGFLGRKCSVKLDE